MLTRGMDVYTLVSTHWSFRMSTSPGQISAWGNGLALRLTKPMAKAAGVADGSPVRVTVQPGRIVIETEAEPTLEQMLAAFDPQKHGGEVMSGSAVGKEAFANGDT
jgi:antitoxin MazE